MKTIGCIGGTSWVSTIDYYRIFNETVMEKLGKTYSAKCIIYSLEFDEIIKLFEQNKWKKITQIMIEAAHNLEKAGADFFLICAVTLHRTADELKEHVNIPLLHIADATAAKINEKKLNSLGLLGTKFTMEQEFFKKQLQEKYGFNVLVPNEEDQKAIHDVLNNELRYGIIMDTSKDLYKKIINQLVKRGAEGIILGCTEIPLLIKQEDVDVIVFNTTRIHAEHAVNLAIK